jgi:hypothetical protein
VDWDSRLLVVERKERKQRSPGKKVVIFSVFCFSKPIPKEGTKVKRSVGAYMGHCVMCLLIISTKQERLGGPELELGG